MADEAPQRLDVLLAEQRGITRHAARVMIDAGLVTLNGRRGRSGQRVRRSERDQRPDDDGDGQWPKGQRPKNHDPPARSGGLPAPCA